MDAEHLLKQGDLDGALAALQSDIRKAPENARLRVFLFQLLAVQGNWQRAVAQLKTSATLDPAAETMAQTYRAAILCEGVREKVFAGLTAPIILGEPEAWTANLIEALKVQARGEFQAAEDLRGEAFEAAPAVPGHLDGVPFSWIADADPRLGPILEVILNGRYVWVPFASLKSLTLEAPSDLRDSVWMPATLTLANGGSSVALIPTRYPGTHKAPDARLHLSHATSFVMEDGLAVAGLGQRLLATDTQECALMNIRELVMGPAQDAGEAEAAEAGLADG
ncbi:type VI secretion system protein ImpE [Roseibium suaedae]|uniref:Type VI secretion system protein ImpE n=2 Tax=Roseibium suaedae TaxID=735517 RepID=A0A1M7PA44_9HYPH|nr:type VI secretion system protein ImpE [Roseibium suaedae]